MKKRVGKDKQGNASTQMMAHKVCLSEYIQFAFAIVLTKSCLVTRLCGGAKPAGRKSGDTPAGLLGATVLHGARSVPTFSVV
jgi:hypothetical protein